MQMVAISTYSYLYRKAYTEPLFDVYQSGVAVTPAIKEGPANILWTS